MKVVSYILFFVLLTWKGAFGQVIEPNSFKATNAGADVILSWTTLDETNVREFQIERRSGEGAEYGIVGTVAASRQSPYTFRDHSAFMKLSSYYSYRLVTVFMDGSKQIFGDEAGIDHTVSGVRRTWGSIKSMFRF